MKLHRVKTVGFLRDEEMIFELFKNLLQFPQNLLKNVLTYIYSNDIMCELRLEDAHRTLTDE